MPDFLLELRCEEIPARMQAGARADLERLVRPAMRDAGVSHGDLTVWSTPRRLTLIARGLPEATEPVSEETKGPRVGAPPQALEGFLRKTGLTESQLTERDGVLFAMTEKPGRATAEVLAEAIPAIVRAFPWPKSMRWGAVSLSTESLRWVRPLSGIVAILGEDIVAFEIGGVTAGATTLGHRFHHPGVITIGGAADYQEKLRACHVIVDHAEREGLIREMARAAALAEGLTLVEDEGLVIENAGLTEWPVPLLGRFDAAFLDVPPEVIQLTARTNQKYFVCEDADGKLANAFVCTANIAAADGGAGIVDGNRKVLAARLSDARFFWDQDRKVPLAEQAKKLERITFHEKLGTVADKVERVAKLARWLVEQGIVGGSSHSPNTTHPVRPEPVEGPHFTAGAAPEEKSGASTSSARTGEELANLAEQAARLCKADLVTEMVGEFPELQGHMGGYYARAEGLPDAVADAIRDHYKPVGQGDEVPIAPVTVAVSLADKLDTIISFFAMGSLPTGSQDPFALRRSAIAIISQINAAQLRFPIRKAIRKAYRIFAESQNATNYRDGLEYYIFWFEKVDIYEADQKVSIFRYQPLEFDAYSDWERFELGRSLAAPIYDKAYKNLEIVHEGLDEPFSVESFFSADRVSALIEKFFADRLKVQQREAGVRHDLIDAVFALGGEDDLVRLLARVHALQAFVGTPDGANLLAGYKRAANILKKEGYAAPLPGGEGPGVGAQPIDQAPSPPPNPPPPGEGSIPQDGEEDPFAMVDDPDIAAAMRERIAVQKTLSYTPEHAEQRLNDSLDSAEPTVSAAVEAEDFAGAMAALASLRAPIDLFFEEVTVNDADPAKRQARLALLGRFRAAVLRVADFSRIEG